MKCRRAAGENPSGWGQRWRNLWGRAVSIEGRRLDVVRWDAGRRSPNRLADGTSFAFSSSGSLWKKGPACSKQAFGMFETSLRHVSGLTRPGLCAVGRADSSSPFPQLFERIRRKKEFLKQYNFYAGARNVCRRFRPHHAFENDLRSCFLKG